MTVVSPSTNHPDIMTGLDPSTHPIRNQHGEQLDTFVHPGKHGDILVILGHGLSGEMNSPVLFWLARGLEKHGWPCVRFSYSGNGKSEGLFTHSNITKETRDLTAIIDQFGAGRKIAYIGHSMGAAVGTLTAARDDRIKLLISLAGMVHTREFAKRELTGTTPNHDTPWKDENTPLSSPLANDLHQIHTTLNAAHTIRLPWLLIHGLDDDIVLPADSRDLHATLRGPKKLVEIAGADHSFEHHYDKLIEECHHWLEKYLGPVAS